MDDELASREMVVQGFRDLAGYGIDRGWDCARTMDYFENAVPGFKDCPIFKTQFPIVFMLAKCEIEIELSEREAKEEEDTGADTR